MPRVAVDLVALGGDDLQPEHTLAGRPDHLAVPPVPTLQQVPAEADAFAVARREEQALGVEVGREGAGDHARTDVGGHRVRVDTAVIETADVEQHAAVTQMACRPAVSAGTNADPVALRTRIADRGDNVVGIAGLHDHIGKALRQNAVPHRRRDGLPRIRLHRGRRIALR